MARERKENRFYKNKTTLTVYLVLRGLIIFILIRAVLRREYQSVFLCSLSLVLMIMPSIISACTVPERSAPTVVLSVILYVR